MSIGGASGGRFDALLPSSPAAQQPVEGWSEPFMVHCSAGEHADRSVRFFHDDFLTHLTGIIVACCGSLRAHAHSECGQSIPCKRRSG
jgi:hypothetical protein